jgi:hypothetical protein
VTHNKLEITPSVTVHDLLKTYPELENVLIEIAPPFEKLKNPVLRKSVAKVATIKHISSVGNMPLNKLISLLKEAVGQPIDTEYYDDQDYFGEQPDWFLPEKIVLSVDDVNAGDKMIIVSILRQAKDVKKGGIIELVTTFLPTPGIEVMKSKGYSVWTLREGDDLIKSFFLKN